MDLNNPISNLVYVSFDTYIVSGPLPPLENFCLGSTPSWGHDTPLQSENFLTPWRKNGWPPPDNRPLAHLWGGWCFLKVVHAKKRLWHFRPPNESRQMITVKIDLGDFCSKWHLTTATIGLGDIRSIANGEKYQYLERKKKFQGF